MSRRLFPIATAIAAAAISMAFGIAVRGQKAEPQPGVLYENPAVNYRFRPTTDRVATLNKEIASGRTLPRETSMDFLLSVLDALGIPVESQLLVFSKTGVQRDYTSPHTPRALYFDQSVVVGYIPGAPLIEVAAHDPQQGVIFYTVDQKAPSAVFKRQTSCLSCHVSASTLDVPGIIARSNTVSEDGNTQPQEGSHDVNHTTPHPDRWGGWFVTSEDAAPPYQQMAHRGNITFSGRQHVEPGVRRLADQRARIARLSAPVQRHRRAAAVRSSGARDQPADAPELGVARRDRRRSIGARTRARELPAVRQAKRRRSRR